MQFLIFIIAIIVVFLTLVSLVILFITLILFKINEKLENIKEKKILLKLTSNDTKDKNLIKLKKKLKSQNNIIYDINDYRSPSYYNHQYKINKMKHI